MGIAEDIVVEHRRIADAMEEVGADAPAGVGAWTAADLAAHLTAQWMGGGVVVFLARSLAARGVRVTDRGGSAARLAISHYRRRGFDTAIEQLRGGVPRLLVRPQVAPVSLFEVWLHHDDLRRANRLAPSAEPESLGAAVEFALRYQRSALGGARVDSSLSHADLLRWLGGRPSSQPPHEPPLRF